MRTLNTLARLALASVVALTLVGGLGGSARADDGPFKPKPRNPNVLTTPPVQPPATKVNPNVLAPSSEPTLVGKTTRHQLGGYIDLKGTNWTPNSAVRFEVEYGPGCQSIVGGTPVCPGYAAGQATTDSRGNFAGSIDARCTPNARAGATVRVYDTVTGYTDSYFTYAYTCK